MKFLLKKNKNYGKWHNSYRHYTNECLTFRNVIQDFVDKGTLKFPEKTKADMRIDSNPLPTPTVTLNVATADLRKLAEPRSTPRPKVELREHLDHKRQERAVKIREKGSKEREYTLSSVAFVTQGKNQPNRLGRVESR